MLHIALESYIDKGAASGGGFGRSSLQSQAND